MATLLKENNRGFSPIEQKIAQTPYLLGTLKGVMSINKDGIEVLRGNISLYKKALEIELGCKLIIK